MIWLRQCLVICRLNLLSLPARWASSLATVFAAALVVLVLLGFLAIAGGFRDTLGASGASDVAVVFRSGAPSEFNSVIITPQVRLIEEAPGVAHDDQGRPLVSPELYLVMSSLRRDTGERVNIPLRGLSAQGAAWRRGMRLASGRMFAPGSDEIVVGASVAKGFAHFDLGATIDLGGKPWRIVGVMAADGTAFGSEVWGDADEIQSLYKRANVYQTVRVKLASPADLARLRAYVADEPRLQLDAKSEADYFAAQSSRLTALVNEIGWPLAIAMALGALAGALNTMYGAVASRAREIATLRAIGFAASSTLVGVLVESLTLFLAGGALGCLVAYLAFDGLAGAAMGDSFTEVSFRLKLGFGDLAHALALAAGVGVLGGVAPALRAARAGIVEGLHS